MALEPLKGQRRRRNWFLPYFVFPGAVPMFSGEQRRVLIPGVLTGTVPLNAPVLVGSTQSGHSAFESAAGLH